MRLNHLNLTIPDVARTREFFETYFGLRCVFERGRDVLAVLVDVFPDQIGHLREHVGRMHLPRQTATGLENLNGQLSQTGTLPLRQQRLHGTGMLVSFHKTPFSENVFENVI